MKLCKFKSGATVIRVKPFLIFLYLISVIVMLAKTKGYTFQI